MHHGRRPEIVHCVEISAALADYPNHRTVIPKSRTVNRPHAPNLDPPIHIGTLRDESPESFSIALLRRIPHCARQLTEALFGVKRVGHLADLLRAPREERRRGGAAMERGLPKKVRVQRGRQEEGRLRDPREHRVRQRPLELRRRRALGIPGQDRRTRGDVRSEYALADALQHGRIWVDAGASEGLLQVSNQARCQVLPAEGA